MLTVKQKKSRKKYFIILFIYTFILFVLAFLGLKVVWNYALEYENSQVDNVLKNYMETINREKWNSSISEAADRLVNEFQDSEDAEAYVKNLLSEGDINYTVAVGAVTDGVLRYALVHNGVQIGTISFSENRDYDSKFNMYPWVLSSESFDFEYLKTGTASVTIPEGYTARLNGVEIGEEYVTESGIHYDVLERFYADYPDLPTKRTFEVTGLLGNLSPVIYDKNGDEFTPDPTAGDMQYVDKCSDSEIFEFRDFMEGGFVEAYAKFWGTKYVDSTYPTLLEYVQMGSALQQDMYTYTLDAATWVHTNSVVITSMSFSYAMSLGGGFYVVSEAYDSTAYAEYKTVTESSEVTVILFKDESGIKAVSVV